MSTPAIKLVEFITGAGGAANGNISLLMLDGILGGAEDYITVAPGSPVHGQVYLIGDGVLTGDDWEGHDNELAFYRNGVWYFVAVVAGFHTFVKDTNCQAYHNGSFWTFPGACYYARNSADQAMTATIDPVDHATALISNADVYNYATSGDDHVEVLVPGVYLVEWEFEVECVGVGSFNYGIGYNSGTAFATPTTKTVSDMGTGARRSCYVSMLQTCAAGDDFYFLFQEASGNFSIEASRSAIRLTLVKPG